MATETIVLTEAPTIDATAHEITQEEKNAQIKSAIQKINDSGSVNTAALTPKEKEECKALTKNLVVTDINSISNYGCELNNAMTRFSNNFLEAVRTQKAGEIGTYINDLLTELEYVDVDDLSTPKAIVKFLRQVPILRHLVASADKVVNKYKKITTNVDTLTNKIEVSRLAALRDNNALQTMFDNNVAYGQQMDKLIIAANVKLEEIDHQLDEMKANKDNYETYQITDVETFRDTLSKKVSDLVALRYVIKMSLPQIREIQKNNILDANKAQTLISTTLPVWRNQISMAVALQNQKERLKAHRMVSDTTNAIIKKNAEMLHLNSVEAAKENERSIIELDTLKKATEEFINMTKEVKRIHEEGVAKRKETEREILRMQDEMDVIATSTANLIPSIGDATSLLENN